jgi:hypothetical protein
VSRAAAKRQRRLRRKARLKLEHGVSAAPIHKNRSGRTGTAHSKKPKSKRADNGTTVEPLTWATPNLPPWLR